MDRRSFLASLTSVLALQTLRSLHMDAQTPFAFSKDPFALGVASGDPAADGVVLWTRLAPEITAPDFGLPNAPVDVMWEVASDSAMHKIVQKGRASATPELNHSVHVEVNGLKPGHEYFYRFHSGGATSQIARTRTAPAMDSTADRVRFAFASCQSYGPGYYTAHADLAKADVDVVFFLGDYIYENKPVIGNARGFVRGFESPSKSAITLDDYRHYYAHYKSDADLIACHQAHPWVVTPDDHEVEDNWAGDHSEHESVPNLFKRRAAAYRAYYENQPLRSLSVPQGDHMQLYRNISYGKLVQFSVLDTRQFRTPQPCNDKPVIDCQERYAATQEFMGVKQAAWLTESLAKSPSQWNIIAQQTQLAQVRHEMPEGPRYSSDDWDGYAAARKRLTDSLAATQPRNPIFVAGDIHRTSISDIKADFNRKDSAVVASEIVGTSITSGGDGTDNNKVAEETMAANPHVVYENRKRGYFLCDVDSKRMHSDLRTVDKVTERGGKVSTKASFEVRNDKKGIRQV